MKQLNANVKQYKYWVNSMAALSLSIALQSKACVGGRPSGGAHDYMANQTEELFFDYVDNSKDISKPQGSNILHSAVDSGQSKYIKYVLERITKDHSKGSPYGPYSNPDFPNATDHKGYTAFGKAIKKGLHDVIQPFIECKLIDRKIGTGPQGKGLNPLLLALENKQHGDKTAAILLKHDKMKKYISTPDNKGNTPMHLVLGTQFKSADEPLQLMVNMLTSLSDLNVQDHNGRTPLHLAAKHNQKNNFKILFEKIQKLASYSKYDIAELLLKKDKADKTRGYSVFANAYIRTNLVEKLLSSANLNEGSSIGMFKFILNIVKKELKADNWFSILKEIEELESSRTIPKKYADKLREALQVYSRYYIPRPTKPNQVVQPAN